MKKFLSVLLTVVLLASFAAVAGAEEKTTITVWCWDPAFNIYAMNEAAKVYAQINPDVEIEVIEVATEDCETRQTAAFISGQMDDLPDIVLMQDNSGQKFLSTYPGMYYDLTDKIDYSNFADFKVNYFVSEGRNYAVPFDNGCAAMFIRTDILEEAGYTLADVTDITWSRFIEIGKDVKEKTGMPILTCEMGFADFLMMIPQSAGTWYFDDEGNPNIAGNEVLKATLETIKQLADAGIVYEAVDWAEYISTLNTGKAASTIQGCWILGSVVLAEDQAGKWGVTNIPRLDNIEGATNYSNQGGSSWLVLANSENAEIAADFLNQTFAGSTEFYQTILKSSGAIATYLPAAEGEAYAEPHEFFGGQAVFADIMEFSAQIPKVELRLYNYEARDALRDALQAYRDGGDLDSLMQEAQDTVEFLMME